MKDDRAGLGATVRRFARAVRRGAAALRGFDLVPRLRATGYHAFNSPPARGGVRPTGRGVVGVESQITNHAFSGPA
jgi:hypothetical protein